MECSNCYEEYDDNKHVPLNLECGHTYCKKCIKKLLKQSPKLECPICRKRISPFINANMLAKNFIVLETSKSLNKIKSFLNFCSKHNLEPQRFYCNNCNLEICSECLINHSGHLIKKQTYSKQIITNKINQLSKQIKKEEKKLQLQLYRNQLKQNDLQKIYKKSDDKIIQFCDQIQQVMNQNFFSIQQNFNFKSNQKINNLQKRNNEVQYFLQDFQNQQEKLNRIENYIQDKKFIKDENYIVQLENLEKKIHKNLELLDKKNQQMTKGKIKICFNDNFQQSIQNSLQIIQEKHEPVLMFFGQKNQILFYKIKQDKWILKTFKQQNIFQNLNFNDYSASCVIENSFVLLFGGGKSKNIIRFDLKSFQFNKVGEMQYNRTEHSVQVIGNRVYIMGGFNREDNICLNECEIFLFDQNINIKMQDMHNKRCGFSSIVFKNNVYVFGGFQGQQRLDQIEKYDPQQNFWIQLDLKLPIKLTNGAAVNYNDKIFIFGGDNEEGFSIRPIKIDLQKQKISYKYRLKKGKDLRGKLFQLEDEIFLIGSNKDSAYSFNFMTDQWKKLQCYDNVLMSSKLDSWTGCLVNLDFSQVPQEFLKNQFIEQMGQSSSSYENLFHNDSVDFQLSLEDSINDVFQSDNEYFFQLISFNNEKKRTGGRIERL